MKKGIVLLITMLTALNASAKEKKTNKYADSLLSRWCIDVNFMGGLVSRSVTYNNTTTSYLNAVNTNAGYARFSTGSSFGGDAQIGFFFGRKRHFGIGTGVLYLMQQDDLHLNGYHVEYEAMDKNNHVYRQIISSDNLREQTKISNFNIPIVAKYKKRLSKHWGFTADAGILINLMEQNKYTTNGAFDYEAIYSRTPEGTFVYDNGATPNAANDIFWTKANFLKYNPNGDVNAYFNQHRADGYNVGLGVTPTNNTGTVSYMTGSVGLLVSPAISLYLSDHVALNLGVHYIYQPFKNNNSNNYQLTNSAGDYNSIQNGVSSARSSSYGANLGIRVFFGKPKDTDGDGIPDKKDLCPDVWGLPQFQGCPDRDGDGIPDKDDLCPDVKGLAQFHGCPDTDGDGIPDKDDACPYDKGLPQFNGCPDRDGDGVIDKDDACPDVKGLAQFHGCPDTDGDGVPDNEDNCPDVAGPIDNHGCPIPPKPVEEQHVEEGPNEDLSQPILFNVNSTVIHKSSMPIIEEAAKEAKASSNAVIRVDGYTDATGSKAYNKKLSVKRAYAVKKTLTKMGVNGKKVKIVGHGESHPVESNKTKEGRLHNRRAQMKLNNGQ